MTIGLTLVKRKTHTMTTVYYEWYKGGGQEKKHRLVYVINM